MDTWKTEVIKRYVVVMIVVALLGGVGYYYWQQYTKKSVIYESQKQSETASGVALAAKEAHIYMLQSQLEEAAGQIAALKNKPPDTIIKTVPVEVLKVIEVERKKRDADFAIVTNPNEPDKKLDSKEIEKLSPDTQITLNQYNVYAYKKIVRGVTIYPDWSKTIHGNLKLQEISADISKKMSKDGKYIGVALGYNVEDSKFKLGLRYTF
ncbi:MAG: hypothetical protein K0R78_1028 [Pelosinus sp.]|jgi:hypothetical protein|nr:hypothetical protein [Pelosinus sp.]